jgi:acetyltransferase-like isoleucine patch superfamily enzyme
MMNMKFMVERLIQIAKKDPLYTIPEHIPTGVLVSEVIGRGLMALRGMCVKWQFQSSNGLLFLGKNVKIRSPRSLSVGGSVSLHDYVHIDALSEKGVTLGNNVTIREYSIVECTGVIRFPGEGLVIGNDVGISQWCYIGARGPVRIGNNVQIGPKVTIYAENHNFDDRNIPIREQGISRQGITIEDDCWLGTGSIILDGVMIGRGSVIAAGCVVTKSVPPFSVVVGVPGHVIRERGEGERYDRGCADKEIKGNSS